ncbi:MAG: hypothetical protein IPG17_27755 [Sandaracinaceae bacterium]|nr:hypothetical protein [Sandaracinaceae bacterium]
MRLRAVPQRDQALHARGGPALRHLSLVTDVGERPREQAKARAVEVAVLEEVGCGHHELPRARRIVVRARFVGSSVSAVGFEARRRLRPR